jgi:hypothetical protein
VIAPTFGEYYAGVLLLVSVIAAAQSDDFVPESHCCMLRALPSVVRKVIPFFSGFNLHRWQPAGFSPAGAFPGRLVV